MSHAQETPVSSSTAAGPSGVVGEVAPPALDPTSEILRVEDLTVRFPTDDGVAIFTVSASSADTADEVATTIRDSIDKA